MHHKNTTSESDMSELRSLDSQFFTYIGTVDKSQARFHATPRENHQGKMEATHQILHQQKMPPSMHTSKKAKDIQRIQSKLISISSWMLILFTIDIKKAQKTKHWAGKQALLIWSQGFQGSGLHRLCWLKPDLVELQCGHLALLRPVCSRILLVVRGRSSSRKRRSRSQRASSASLAHIKGKWQCLSFIYDGSPSPLDSGKSTAWSNQFQSMSLVDLVGPP